METILTSHTQPFVLTGALSDPKPLDYDLLGLHKKRIMTNGFLTRVEYYKNYDGTTYADLAVAEDRVYTVTPGTDFVQKRDMTISWYYVDGTVGDTFATTKFYSPTEQLAEGKTRRRNVVETASIYLVSQVGVPNAQDFLRAVAPLMDLYVSGSRQELIDYVTAATQPYLTPTIIGTLVAILNYAN